MSKISPKIHVKQGNTVQEVSLYTTTEEASAYGTYGLARYNNAACYYGLGTGADVAHGSTAVTPVNVIKNNVNYYMLTKGNAELATYALTLAATSNQTITLKYKNRNITDSGFETEATVTSTSSAQNYTVRNGSTWTATVAGATGWNAGALSPGASGTISAATTVTAAAATYKTFTLTLSATSNQTITLKYKNKKSDGTFDSEVTKTSTGSAQAFTVGYGTTWTASVAGATGWNAGAISASSGTVTAATTVSAGTATLKTYTLTLAGTSNQTITLKYTEPNASQVTKTSTSSNQNFTVKHGTTWTATVAGASGYNPGTLSASSGTVTAATTVSVSAASAIIVLTDSYYMMSDVYPSTYRTMTTVPNALDTSNVTDMYYMFDGCSKLTSIPTLNTSNVTGMYSMFRDCSKLTSIPQLSTSNVTNMGSMFNGCYNLTTIPTLNTGNVTMMYSMFNYCSSLTSVPQLNTSKVINMSSMFNSCSSLTTIPTLNTGEVIDMDSMFKGCYNLTTIPQLDTSEVTNMGTMFEGCTSLPATFPWVIDCSSITDARGGADMHWMFYSSSVTKVTLKNVSSSIKSSITSQYLKGDNTLTITFA